MKNTVEIKITFNPNDGNPGIRPLGEYLIYKELKEKEMWLDPDTECEVTLPNDAKFIFTKLTKDKWRFYEELKEKGKFLIGENEEHTGSLYEAVNKLLDRANLSSFKI